MWWVILAGVPSFLYAVANHIDKHLLEEHFKMQGGPTILVVVSALLSAIPLPLLFFLSPSSVIPENLWHIPALVVMGWLYAALLWFYLQALNEEDTTTIIIFYSFLPLAGLFTSNIFLGETLLPMQLVAMTVIVFGIAIVSFEKNGNEGYRFKGKAALLMFLASLCWALGDVVFKAVALEDSIWPTLFWEHLILFLTGLWVYLFSPNIRRQLSYVLKENSLKITSINLTSEGLYIIANIISAFPLLMVQVAAVHLVQAFQPVWVFVIALALMHLGYSKDEFTRGQLIQKATATGVAVYGMYLLVVNTPVA